MSVVITGVTPVLKIFDVPLAKAFYGGHLGARSTGRTVTAPDPSTSRCHEGRS